MSSDDAGSVPWLRFAVGDLIRDRQRTVLSLTVLVPAVVAFLVMASVSQAMAGARGAPAEVLNLAVVAENALDFTTGRLDDEDQAAVAAAAGDDAAQVSGLVVRASAIDEHVVQLRAAPRGTWRDVHGLRLLSGTWPTENELAVTEGVQAATGWEVGSSVELYGSRLRVAALVAAPGTKFATVWMDLGRAQRLFDEPGHVQAIVVTLRPSADAGLVIDRIAGAPGLRGRVAVFRESAIAGEVTRLVQFGSSLAALIALLAVATLALTVFNLVGLTALERGADLGVLRVLGFDPRSLRKIATARAALLSLVAYSVGTALVAPWLAQLPPVVLRSVTVETRLGPVVVGLGAALAVVCASVAAWAGLRRALASNVHDLVERT